MKTVSIDIETVLDEEAAERCGYVPSDEFAPFPLHTVVCASAFSVTSTAKGEHFYALESFSKSTMSERGIIASVEEAIVDANVMLTYNGSNFDLPVLLTRAMVHELHVPRLIDMQNRARVGRHVDLFEQLRREASPVSLRQLCAPFAIPVKQLPSMCVPEHVALRDWRSLERYCESDAVGCWLAAQFWNKVQEPGFARETWREFSRWVASNLGEHPGLESFAVVPERPRVTYPVAGLDDFHF